MDENNKEKIVCVSGGMDPVHSGHIAYFKAAKQLAGDKGKGVCILNSDKFLEAKKGFAFMDYNERKSVLEAIRYIDKVVECIDDDQTVIKTLASIKPDVFAKGGDRTLGNIPEKAICEELGIEMIFGVGEGKTQSSSWLIESLKKNLLK